MCLYTTWDLALLHWIAQIATTNILNCLNCLAVFADNTVMQPMSSPPVRDS